MAMGARKPDSEVSVCLIRCKQCSNPVLAVVVHMMDKSDKKEIANLIAEGHPTSTMPLLEYRKLSITGWCNTKCKTGTELTVNNKI